MKNSKRILTLIILFVSVLLFSMLTVTAAIVSEQQTDTTNDGAIQIEAKYKKISTNKVTFNANGGKIGTKTKVAKNINKGAKIKKFPATAKRKGYVFKGWYTKKSGGKKASMNTKPTKSVTLYAHRKKGSSRTLTSEEKKLVGMWRKPIVYPPDPKRYSFRADGTFLYTAKIEETKIGNYKVSGGKITFTNVKWTVRDVKKDYPNTVAEYRFEKSSDGELLLNIADLDYSDKNYLPLEGFGDRWMKVT